MLYVYRRTRYILHCYEYIVCSDERCIFDCDFNVFMLIIIICLEIGLGTIETHSRINARALELMVKWSYEREFYEFPFGSFAFVFNSVNYRLSVQEAQNGNDLGGCLWHFIGTHKCKVIVLNWKQKIVTKAIIYIAKCLWLSPSLRVLRTESANIPCVHYVQVVQNFQRFSAKVSICFIPNKAHLIENVILWTIRIHIQIIVSIWSFADISCITIIA